MAKGVSENDTNGGDVGNNVGTKEDEKMEEATSMNREIEMLKLLIRFEKVIYEDRIEDIVFSKAAAIDELVRAIVNGNDGTTVLSKDGKMQVESLVSFRTGENASKYVDEVTVQFNGGHRISMLIKVNSTMLFKEIKDLEKVEEALSKWKINMYPHQLSPGQIGRAHV